MVVDDDEDIRLLWRTCLTMAGFLVTEAANGADGIAQALLGAPSVILMDFSMPGMDGAATVRALKLHACTQATPVIGITAHGASLMTRDFWCLCDAVLEKPVSPDALMGALRQVLGGARPCATA